MAILVRNWKEKADGNDVSARPRARPTLAHPLIHLIESNRRQAIWLAALFPLAFVLGMILGKLVAPRLYQIVIGEDHLVEYATAFVYLIACGFASKLALDLARNDEAIFGSLYFGLAAGLFLIAMEEISWGQRILNLKSPYLFETYNKKDEINIHNVYGFPLHAMFVIIGFYGAFARMLAPPSFKMRYPRLIGLLTPSYYLFMYFFFTLALYVYYYYLEFVYLIPMRMGWSEFWANGHLVTGKDQEPIELLLSLGFLLFVAVNRCRYGRAS